GIPFLNQINSGVVPRFAAGGYVDPELLRREETARRLEQSRKFGTISGGYGAGEVYVRFTKDGRPSFSNSSDRGGIDISTLRGAPLTSKAAFEAELDRR